MPDMADMGEMPEMDHLTTVENAEEMGQMNGANGTGTSVVANTTDDLGDLNTMDDLDTYGDLDSLDDMPDMSDMQRLLDEQETQFRTLKRGDVVEGQIVRIDQDEILVDIGLKSEGVLSTKELPPQGYGSLAELNVGDDVLVYVMQPETPEGHAVVSIKRARQERQWRIAQEQFERGDLLEAEVIDHNKGGLIVNLEGIRGFVPISQILNLRREDSADNAETQNKLQSMVGRRLQLKIIEINRNRNRLILSERLAVQEWRARRREELLNELQVGEVRQGIVSNLANFGAFVDLGGADGLVHISQLAWSRVNHPSEVLKVGQKVEVQVLSVDRDKKKIALSIKRAEVDPWTTVEQRYHIDQLVNGTITKIAPFGAFARIEDGVEGLIHLSELPSGQQDPKSALREGQDITVRILRIDPERRRLGLSIRQVDGNQTNAPAEMEAETRADEERAESVEGSAQALGEARSTERATPRPPAPRPAPAPRQEESPATAMAAAFAAAQQRREQEVTEPEGASQANGSAAATAPTADAPASTTATPATEAPAAPAAASAVEAPPAAEAPAAEAPAAEAPAAVEAPAAPETASVAEAAPADEAAPAEAPTTEAPAAPVAQADATETQVADESDEPAAASEPQPDETPSQA
ncbi:MAG TPA: S1 RNA-binding domain-containing protein [Ktedonobacterales bacterium]|nr:S1 RNA-binding domain-containing protein [Ktedonobacterales bacterium]